MIDCTYLLAYIYIYIHATPLSLSIIDDSVKGGLTQFWELFTMIPRYLKTFGFQIENKGSLQVEEAIL